MKFHWFLRLIIDWIIGLNIFNFSSTNFDYTGQAQSIIRMNLTNGTNIKQNTHEKHTQKCVEFPNETFHPKTQNRSVFAPS